MDTQSSNGELAAGVQTRASLGAVGFAGLFLLVATAGALIVYKASGALAVLTRVHADGTLALKVRPIAVEGLSGLVRPVAESLNYLSWVFVALAFGILIGAMVRAFVPSRWLMSAVGGSGARTQIGAALVGAPLMLCSCCAAPLFEGAYARTRRLGPALGILFAPPALNPAVLAGTFLLFSPAIAWTRLLVSALLVIVGAAALGRAFPDVRAPEACPVEINGPSWRGLARSFGQSLRSVAWRSVPAILLGVVLSAAIAGLVPLDTLARAGDGVGAGTVIVLVALVAVPLALPTFGEIPLALALLAAGAPAGAAAALLVAGPAINLPSLVTLCRTASWRVAAATAAAVLVAALAAAVIVEALL